MNANVRRAMALAVMCGAASAALSASKPAADIAVKMNFSASSTDRITSDGLAATGYADAYVNGVENVLAIIQTSGNLRFATQHDTRVAAVRAVCIDFATQFADQDKPVPFADANPRQCVNAMQPMHAYLTGDVAIMNLRYGQSVDKLTRFEWNEGTWRYRVGFGTDLNRDGTNDSPSVRVTCIAADTSGRCTKWVLAPVGNGEAVLYRFPTKRGTVQESDGQLVANVVMPFSQTFDMK